MAKSDLKQLIVRAILDREFRLQLIDPARAVKAAGLSLTEEEMTAVMSLEFEEWDTMTLRELDERLESFEEQSKTITTIKF